ncbi:MAG: hypothetical protein AB9869_10350 [Verrucomicrobiia bacterium]
MAADGAGNVFVAGNTIFGWYPGSKWYPPCNVTKLDSKGAVLWTRTLQSSSVISLATDTAGACYATGYAPLVDSFTAAGVVPTGSGSAFVAKFSPAGQLQWIRLEGGPQTVIPTSWTSSDSYLYAPVVKVDRSDNLYLAGIYSRNVTIGGTTLPPTTGSTIDQMFLAKYNKDGALQWVRTTADADILGSDIAVVLLGTFSSRRSTSPSMVKLGSAMAFSPSMIRTAPCFDRGQRAVRVRDLGAFNQERFSHQKAL